ncbi:MAG: hypothetical protein OD817_08370 [Gammaproteobacteria bacterium]
MINQNDFKNLASQAQEKIKAANAAGKKARAAHDSKDGDKLVAALSEVQKNLSAAGAMYSAAATDIGGTINDLKEVRANHMSALKRHGGQER